MLLTIIGIIVILGALIVCFPELRNAHKGNMKTYAAGYITALVAVVLMKVLPNPLSDYAIYTVGVIAVIAVVSNAFKAWDLLKVAKANINGTLEELARNPKLSTKGQAAILNQAITTIEKKTSQRAIDALAGAEHTSPSVLRAIAAQGVYATPVALLANPTSDSFTLEMVAVTNDYSPEAVYALAKNPGATMKAYISLLNMAPVERFELIESEGTDIEGIDIILREMKSMDPSLENVPNRYILAAYTY